jgi:hypothetical protein
MLTVSPISGVRYCASIAARIVGDHSTSRPTASCSFQRTALNDGLRLGTRGLVGGIALEAPLHVEPTRPDRHDGPHSPDQDRANAFNV